MGSLNGARLAQDHRYPVLGTSSDKYGIKPRAPALLRSAIDSPCSIAELRKRVHEYLKILFGCDDDLTGGGEPVYVTIQSQIVGDSPFVLASSFYRDLNPLYVDFIRSLDVDPEKALKFDIHGFKHYSCSNNSCWVGSVYCPIVTCGRYHPHASSRHTSRCVARIMEKVEFVEKHTPADYLIGIDLTCPAWVSRSKRYGDLKKLRKAVNLFLKNLHRELFRDHKSQLGGFYGIHVWKTSKPIEPHYHVHLNLFNVGYNRNDKMFHRFKPFISEHRVKLAWKKSLVAVGLWNLVSEPELPDAWVHFIKLSDRGRVAHRIRYVFRKPIVDLNEHIGNCDLSDLDNVWVRFLLGYTPRQTFVGFATSLKRFGFNSNKSCLPRCPICGGKLRLVDMVSEIPPDIRWFSLDRAGKLVEIKPPPS